MTTFTIREIDSAVRSGLVEHAFSDDSAQADKLVVDVDAFLVAQGQGAAGAFLAPTRAWTATVSGTVFSLQYAGLYLDWGNTAASTITLSEEGSIGGVYGIYALSSATIKNAGVIAGRDHGIRISDPGTRTITNGGSISGGLFGIVDESGTSVDKVTNTGTIIGHVDLGGGDNAFSSAGDVDGDFTAQGGNDSFKNTGSLSGSVRLGEGANRFENSGAISGDVIAGNGDDVLVNSGTVAEVNLGAGTNSLTNSGSVREVVSGNDNTKIVNSGLMRSIEFLGGNNTVTNSGTIFLGVDLMGGIDFVTNSGSIYDVNLGGGVDTLTNSGTITEVTGGPGRTIITNRGTIDVLRLEGANTIVNSGVINGILFLGNGNDTVTNSGTINSNIDLGAGNDVYSGGAQSEFVFDGAGEDIYRLGAGDDTYFAGGQNVGALDGADVVDGGAGVDTYLPSATSFINIDTVSHTMLDILPFANFGVAYAANSAGNSLVPGALKDTVIGFENVEGTGNHIIFGSSAANELRGSGGLLGFGGNDSLRGLADDDKLYGGAGRDLLTGGAGADGYFYSAVSESGPKLSQRDTITDFENGLDYISLVRIDANTKTGPANDAFNFIGFNVKFSGAGGELRAVFAADGVLIEGDVNGDKKADLSILLLDPTHTLNASTLTADDFWL